MTKRRTAERAVIDAALEWRHYGEKNETTDPGSYALFCDARDRLWTATRKLADLDLEPAIAVRTSAMPMATSADAAAYMSKRVNQVVGEVFREILSVYRQGAFGLTTDSIEVRLRRSHQSVSPRVTDLRDRGWIADSGIKRKTRYGQEATVWKPTDAALEAVADIPEWSW